LYPLLFKIRFILSYLIMQSSPAQTRKVASSPSLTVRKYHLLLYLLHSTHTGFAQFANHSAKADNYVYFYFFNIENPDGMLNGEKPMVKEIGPFIYNVSNTSHTMGVPSFFPLFTVCMDI
jgi:hypothetical protein